MPMARCCLSLLTEGMRKAKVAGMSKVYFSFVVVILLLAGCRSADSTPFIPITPTPLSAHPTIGLSDSATALLSADHGWTGQWITSNESALSADLQAGVLDAVLLYHLPSTLEVAWISPILLDGLVVIVHPQNPLTTLDLPTLQAVFGEKLGDWGGFSADYSGPIHPIVRETGSGVAEIWQKRVMGERRIGINVQIATSWAEIVERVSADSQAISYVPFSQLQPLLANNTIRPLQLEGIPAQQSTLEDQQYPLMMPLYWVSPQEPSGTERAWLAWVQSADGQTTFTTWFGRVRR